MRSPIRANVQDGKPRIALLLIAFMLAVIVFRLHEALPVLSIVKPGFLAGPVGVTILLIISAPGTFNRILEDKTVQGVALYVSWTAITVPFALYASLALDTVTGITSLLLLVGGLSMLDARPSTVTSLFWLVLSLGSALAVLAYLMGGDAGRLGFGSSLDPNDLGAIMVALIPIGIGLFRRSSAVPRLIAMCCTAFIIFIMISTNSRGATVAFVASMLAFIVVIPPRKILQWALALVVVGTIAWSAAPPSFKERMATLADTSDDYNTTAYGGRKQIWKRGISYALASPVVGVGAGNFPIAEGDRLTEQGLTGKWSAAHNSYVQAAAELGFVGLAIYVYLLGRAILFAWRWSRLERVTHGRLGGPELFSSLVGLSVAAYFLSHAYFWMIFATIGITGVAERVRVSVTDSYTLSNLSKPSFIRTRNKGYRLRSTVAPEPTTRPYR